MEKFLIFFCFLIFCEFSMAQFIEQDPGYLCYDGQWLASINRCNGYPDCAQGKTRVFTLFSVKSRDHLVLTLAR